MKKCTRVVMAKPDYKHTKGMKEVEDTIITILEESLLKEED